jgi:hypothetical protein
MPQLQGNSLKRVAVGIFAAARHKKERSFYFIIKKREGRVGAAGPMPCCRGGKKPPVN